MKIMKQIEIIKCDEDNEFGYIIEINKKYVKIYNNTLCRVEDWDLEDFKQCVVYLCK